MEKKQERKPARKLEKKVGVPYYLQLKAILKNLIHSGDLKEGRIPPVRQLAREYGVSINTALRAYESLRREGLIAGAVGRGTFVTASTLQAQRHNRQELLRRVVEHALEEALSLACSIEEFSEAVEELLAEKRDSLSKVRLAFIECNIEQLLYFTDHLDLDPHIHRLPVLLDDVRKAGQDTMEQLASSDIVVTSFYHAEEVRGRLAGLGKPIVGVSLEPEIGTIIRIAKIPRSSTLGLVTTSEDFRRIIREILSELDLRFERILETTARGLEEVRELARQCDALLVSPQRLEQVRQAARPGAEVIEFVFTPDRTSVNNLKVALLELRGRGKP
jgi:GntR family transcriptional regulator